MVSLRMATNIIIFNNREITRLNVSNVTPYNYELSVNFGTFTSKTTSIEI